MAESKRIANLYKPKFVPKGWGSEQWIANNDEYCGKILTIDQGKQCSIHFHILKHETFYIQSGQVRLELIHKDGTSEILMMVPGDTLEVPQGLMHRFTAIGGPAVMIEFSTRHRDEDSYRIQKGD